MAITTHMNMLNTEDKVSLERLIDFCKFLEFKDQTEAEDKETIASSRNAYTLISAYLRLTPYDDFSYDTEAQRNSILVNYRELNPYYIGVLKKIGYIYPDNTYVEQMKFVAKVVEIRLATDNDIIHYLENFLNPTALKLFIKYYKENLTYFNSVLHNDGLKQYEKYWNLKNFFITMHTIERINTSKMELIFDIDSYDERSIRNMFASYGLEFFTDLPNKYRLRILKNINKFLEYKGTSQVIIDIMGMFGYDWTKIYKYYLIKDYKRDPEDPSRTILNLLNVDKSVTPELKFLKVPIEEEDLEANIRELDKDDGYERQKRLSPYTAFVDDDPYWQITEEEAARYEFSYINTKYLGVEIVTDLKRNTMEHAYFYNWLKYFKDSDNPSVSPVSMYLTNFKISQTPIHIFDMLIAFHCLTFRVLGVDDYIIKDFNTIDNLVEYPPTFYSFTEDDTDLWNPYLSYEENVEELHHRRMYRQKGVNALYSIPKDTDGPHSESEVFLKSYQTNLDHRAQFEEILAEENDYEVYKFLRDKFDKKFISEINNKVFDGYDSYLDYIKASNEDLYNYVTEELQADNAMSTKFLEVASMLESFADSLPGTDVSFPIMQNSFMMDYFKKHIFKIINLFKSYTVQLKDIERIYIYKDPLDESLRLREVNYFWVYLFFAEKYFTIANYKEEFFWNIKDEKSAAIDLDDLENFFVNLKEVAEMDLYDYLEGIRIKYYMSEDYFTIMAYDEEVSLFKVLTKSGEILYKDLSDFLIKFKELNILTLEDDIGLTVYNSVNEKYFTKAEYSEELNLSVKVQESASILLQALGIYLIKCLEADMVNHQDKLEEFRVYNSVADKYTTLNELYDEIGSLNKIQKDANIIYQELAIYFLKLQHASSIDHQDKLEEFRVYNSVADKYTTLNELYDEIGSLTKIQKDASIIYQELAIYFLKLQHASSIDHKDKLEEFRVYNSVADNYFTLSNYYEEIKVLSILEASESIVFSEDSVNLVNLLLETHSRIQDEVQCMQVLNTVSEQYFNPLNYKEKISKNSLLRMNGSILFMDVWRTLIHTKFKEEYKSLDKIQRLSISDSIPDSYYTLYNYREQLVKAPLILNNAHLVLRDSFNIKEI